MRMHADPPTPSNLARFIFHWLLSMVEQIQNEPYPAVHFYTRLQSCSDGTIDIIAATIRSDDFIMIQHIIRYMTVYESRGRTARAT